MRLNRFSFFAGWIAVAVLAAVGFAAFGAPSGNGGTADVRQLSATMGHTAGAYAGLSFALVAGDDVSDSSNVPQVVSEPVSDDSSDEPTPGPSTSDSGWLSEVQVRELVSTYFKPRDVNKAVRIAWCESRFNPESINLRTGGIGLFQHLPKYWPDRAAKAGFENSDPRNPEASTAAAAWAVYHGGGWDIFSCR